MMAIENCVQLSASNLNVIPLATPALLNNQVRLLFPLKADGLRLAEVIVSSSECRFKSNICCYTVLFCGLTAFAAGRCKAQLRRARQRGCRL
jgi:hypothetical protein